MDIITGFEHYGRLDRQCYFAFGSNMNPGSLQSAILPPALCARSVCRAIGWPFMAANGCGTAGGGRSAGIGQQVWGVLYELWFGDAASLDVWSSVRVGGGGAYFHYPC